MKRFAYCVLLVGLAPMMAAKAQVVSINDGWNFHRLDAAQQVTEIKNQGSDWSSQYNIQHVDTGDSDLSVSASTLQSEQEKLKSGRWESVRLPHTPNIEPLVVLHQWQGICYYRRTLSVSAEEMSKHTWLEFEGAMHLADLWVNGKHVAQHVGGFTPFVSDITEFLKEGENELLVRLDNQDNALIPPGKPLADLDFNYFGGLYRDARIIRKGDVHITNAIMANEVAGGGIFVTYPQVSSDEATVSVKTQVANTLGESREVTVRQTLREWKKGKSGKAVAVSEQAVTLNAKATKHIQQDIRVEQPRLWYPDSPALYVLCTEVLSGKEVLDSEETRIGIRRIEMTKEKGCLINGKPFRLEGSNRHQEYPYVGYAVSDQAHYRDMWQVRNNGFNIVRLGHYPQDPAVLDACDELGLLAIEPIPGWQFFNRDPRFTAQTYQDVRDLIRRARNHPSILFWETTLNESWPPTEWKDGAVRTAHEEYPGNQCYTSGDSYGYDGFDVCYNDWQEGFNRPNRTGKPGFIREYYDYEFGGHYSTSRVTAGDGDRALQRNAWNAQWSHNRYRAYYPATMGQAVWSMNDYNRGSCDNICKSGVVDMFRLPKFSLNYFRLQTPAGAYTPAGKMPYEVFITSHWLEGSADTVVVYGNVDEVALLLNGREVARQKPDTGGATGYDINMRGNNVNNLTCPPFTFFGVKWQAGQLQAVGYKDGKAVARHTVSTPGAPEKLSINYFEEGVKASRNDVLLVYVHVQDARGTDCFGENSRQVTLQVEKGGELRGPATVTAEAGIASFVVATSDAKVLKLRATSGSLQQSKTIKLKK